MGFGLLQLSIFNQTVFYLYFFFPPGWNERLNDLFSTVWKLANVIKVQRHVNASPAAYNVFTCHRVTCGRNMLTVGESFSIYWQKQIDLVVEYDRMHLYSGFPAAGKPKDLPTPSVCVRRRLSARVRVAHAGECWPGSRLAAPVSIWCWQFTQAIFSTAPGCINTQFPFSEGSLTATGLKTWRCFIYRTTCCKNIRIYTSMHVTWGQQPHKGIFIWLV